MLLAEIPFSQASAQAVAPPAVAPPAPTLLHDTLGLSEDFIIRGQLRPRFEALGGQFRPAPAARGDRAFFMQSLLFAEYRHGAFRFGGELQDSRTYFQTARSTVGTTEVNALEPLQAYVGTDLTKTFGLPGALTAGRFTMDIGSRRLVARNNYRNTINSFTGLRYDWAGENGDTLRLFYTLPDYRLPDELAEIRSNAVQVDRPSTALQFFGGAYKIANVFGGSVQLQSYGLTEYDTVDLPTRNRNLFTPAIRFARESVVGRFDYDFEGVYQTGRSRTSTSAADRTDRPVSAYLFHGEVGYTFDAPWLPRLAVLYDQASGNRAGARTYSRFDTLFGARRWEFGPTGLFGAVQRSNLISPGLHLDIVPNKRWDAFMTYRPLFLESATDAFATTQIIDPTGRSGRFAGQQLETRIRYWVVPKSVRIDSGVACIIKGPFLRNAPNVQDKNNTIFGYSSMIINF